MVIGADCGFTLFMWIRQSTLSSKSPGIALDRPYFAKKLMHASYQLYTNMYVSSAGNQLALPGFSVFQAGGCYSTFFMVG